ncbi:hypothetical protein SDC9_151462 [bioreactor metagenome]|uniref:Uncharacterized protein n=1 Tax=bioreactor metagenome TaxID=1076179 RepID=A0A645ES03_9ZZZZ
MLAHTQVHIVDGGSVRLRRGLAAKAQLQRKIGEQASRESLHVLHACHQRPYGVDASSAQHKGAAGIAVVVRVIDAHMKASIELAVTIHAQCTMVRTGTGVRFHGIQPNPFATVAIAHADRPGRDAIK